MATRLYPPVIEDVLPAFCLNFDEDGNRLGVSINIGFNLNKAVAETEIGGLALRLRTISTNTYIVTENLEVNLDTNKGEGYAYIYNLVEGTSTFQINALYNPDAISALKVGQYYKAQLAFVALDGTVGYWSTVSTIKCVAKPSVYIANFDPRDANIFNNELIGEYVQDTSNGDSSEKVYSYQFQIWDSANNILADSGVQLHNSSQDSSSYSSTDSFTCHKALREDTIYYAQYSVTTINGLVVISPTYQIITVDSLNPEEDITLNVSIDYNTKLDNIIPRDEGVVRIYIDFNGNVSNAINEDGSAKRITGNFVILRSSSKDNYGTWEEVRRFRLVEEVPSEHIIYDYTVEQGITYRYAVQQYNRQEFYSKKVYAYLRNADGTVMVDKNGIALENYVTADFEDMFLYDGTRQLKIRFNPKVNSFKNDLQEQKIDTIGSKHPFIFRNGNICYKEFPISGLISFQMDDANFFINTEDYQQMNLSRFEDNNIRDIGIKSIRYEAISRSGFPTQRNFTVLYERGYLPKDTNEINLHENTNEVIELDNTNVNIYYTPIRDYTEARTKFQRGITLYKKILETSPMYHDDSDTYEKTDLTGTNITSERYFKLLILDWLTDGKPKLFRSPTEGNYLVRLLNVSLTPKTELGRMIHEFSCTAYEIADFNYESLISLGILSTAKLLEEEYQWYSLNAKDIISSNVDTEGFYVINLDGKELVNFTCTNFAPGDQIKLTFKDIVKSSTVFIGASGNYVYNDGNIIIGLAIKPNSDSPALSRDISLAIKGYTYQKFDTVSQITTHTQLGVQLVGPIENFLEDTVVGSHDNINDYGYASNVYLAKDENGVKAQKIKVSEILHFHAKRREVIPIFMNYNGAINASSLSINPNTPDQPPLAVFSLTPFGTGYLQYQSIMSDLGITGQYYTEWIETIGNLTQEEREEQRTINNLVDFVIDKCNGDEFCLFEVYVPNASSGQLATDWVPYSQGSYATDDFTSGIYDPWLYHRQKEYEPDERNPSILRNTDSSALYANARLKDQAFFNNVIQVSNELLNHHQQYEIPNGTQAGWWKGPAQMYDDGTCVDLIEQYQIAHNKAITAISTNDAKKQQCIYNNNSLVDKLIKLSPKLNEYIVNDENGLLTIDVNSVIRTVEQQDNTVETFYNFMIFNLPQLYNPTFTIGYSLDEDEDLLFDVENEDFTQENIAVPKKLQIGNGTIVELIYRIQCIDYTIENENTQIRNAKYIYLKAKEEAIAAIGEYRIATYIKSTGEDLREKYAALLAKVSDFEKYKAVVQLLAETAQRKQIAILKQYYSEKERPLINAMAIQVETIDENLIEELGDAYSTASFRLNNATFRNAMTTYNSIIDEFLDDTISPPKIKLTDVSTYGIRYTKNNIDIAMQEVNNELNSYIYHIINSTTPLYNVFNILQYYINALRNIALERINNDMDALGSVSYVSQYAEQLQARGLEIFTHNCANELAIDDFYCNHLPTSLPVYQLFHKNAAIPTELLLNTSILDSTWENYFHIGIEDTLPHVVLVVKEEDRDTAVPHYEFQGLEVYKNLYNNNTNESYIYNASGRNFVDDLEAKLMIYNQAVDNLLAGGNSYEERVQDYITNYQSNYINNSESNLGPCPVADSDIARQFQLGAIARTGNNTYSIATSWLNVVIDNYILQFPNNSLDDMWASAILTNSLVYQLSGSESTTNIQNKLKEYVEYYFNNVNNIRTNYQSAKICVEYLNEHIHDLTNAQIEIINETLGSFYDKYHGTSNNQMQILWSAITESINQQNADWTALQTKDSITDQYRTLYSYVESFNKFITIKTKAVREFQSLRTQLQTILDRYNISDNIRVALYEEQQIYINAINQAQEALDSYKVAYEAYQVDVPYQAYIDFLQSYIIYNSSTMEGYESSDTYRQLLNEINNKMNLVVNENNRPIKKQLMVTSAWRHFLDVLASIYNEEIKERFGE